MQSPIRYRIRKEDGRIKFAGTGEDSWFTLEQARDHVNYDNGEAIIEYENGRALWEVF